MTEILSKRFEDIVFADVEGLISEGASEDDRLEFKSALSSKKQDDPWYTGANEIGDKARNELLEEIVAFANAYGGCLVLGMEETPDKPPRAAKIRSVPRCIELADRLALQARDCIEPKLPLIQIRGIPTGGDGAGVVVMRVETSRLRPHRLLANKECYVRRCDRSEKMTMREIRDLTLLSHFEGQGRDERFLEKQAKFRQRMTTYVPPQQALGISITALPVGADISVERVHNITELRPVGDDCSIVINDGQPQEVVYPRYSLNYRPAIRATTGISDRTIDSLLTELHCDGTFHTELIQQGRGRGFGVYVSHLVAMTINAIRTCDNLRRYAGAPDLEYGLQIEINHTVDSLPFYRFGDASFSVGAFDEQRVVLPRYSMGCVEELGSLVTLLVSDLWDAAGIGGDRDWTIRVL